MDSVDRFNEHLVNYEQISNIDPSKRFLSPKEQKLSYFSYRYPSLHRKDAVGSIFVPFYTVLIKTGSEQL